MSDDEERDDRDHMREGHEMSFPITAVGASAGGLEALEAFVEELPEQMGMAVVILTHGERSRASHMAELLAAHTEVPCLQVEDGTELKANRIYVCPLGQAVEMVDGVLRVLEGEGQEKHAIDRLFRSMAEDQGSRIMGVVLSGALTDGTLGLREIQATGGVTFAQEESTASYPDMPGSAIASGHVDVVAPPGEIAKELVRIAKEAPLTQESREERAKRFTERQLDEVFDLVEKATGVDFATYKRPTLLRRIERRMLATGAQGTEEYLDVLRSDPEEPGRLHDDSLIQVTRFFRDPELYEALREEAFPHLIQASSKQRPIRIWAPGCATGEEVYSLAIALDEFLLDQAGTHSVQLFGTDLSEDAIETARRGWYPAGIEEDVSPERLQTYFVKDGEGYKIKESTRARCIFARQDVTRDPPFSEIDLISCRNLLIYLEAPLQERVAATFHYALVEGGLLVLGSAETAGRFNRLFKPMDGSNTIYRRADVETPALHTGGPVKGASAGARGRDKHAYPSRGEFDLNQEADRLALATYAPPGVIIDQDFEILQFRGQVGPYVAPAEGQASLNLMRMAPQGLAMAIRGLVEKARETGETPVEHDVRFEGPGGVQNVDVRVSPMDPRRSGAAMIYLVSFEAPQAEDREAAETAQRPGLLDRLFSWIPANPGPEANPGHVRELEEELASTHEYLQTIVEEYEATNEELRSANEEALSTNEELQSTNEELETAKEELQSTNEELSTLNEELRQRNEELQRVNDDLVNLVASVDIPILMVGPDMRIRRFTPRAQKVINLLDSDVGRPLTDLNHRFPDVALDELILEVLDSLQVVEDEVEDENGEVYHLRVHPYRTSDNKIEGAVLVFQEGE